MYALHYLTLVLVIIYVNGKNSNLNVEYQWSYINYTWPSRENYQKAVADKSYVPENNAMAGIKIYKDNLYFALPRLRNGTPVTLARIYLNSSLQTNQLLTPYPSWDLNVKKNCSTLQSVQSMEIDTKGIMWILDGLRFNNNTNCPAKLVLLDLNNNGKVIHTYVFPEQLALSDGAYLNDIVIDDTDGVYAYITDASVQDPGLIVYSVQKNKAWKIRDSTMFAEINGTGYVVEGLEMTNLYPIDGLALSPKSRDEERYVYFSPLVGDNLYSISTKILKDEDACKKDGWRKNVTLVGAKESASDGMMMDNTGVLYYTLLPLYGVGKWNSRHEFSSSEIAFQDKNTIVWPDSFTFDNNGNLYLLSDNINKFLNTSYPLKLSSKIMFRVSKTHTGTRSYLY